MAYNRNFCNNYYGDNFTFHNQYPNPVPPHPGTRFPAFTPSPCISDQEFVNKLILKVNTQKTKRKPKSINIRELREKLHAITSNLMEIQQKQKELTENVEKYTEDLWNTEMNLISIKKASINVLITQFSGPYIDLARKYLTKRTAKRLRLKRLSVERKQQKVEIINERKERSRKIDENLQKIKNVILQSKQEEKAKLEADIVLKDVRRKKIDAKKCLVKLDALLKLRQARLNTAKGRGQSVSEHEGTLFEKNIEKLKTLWLQRLEVYDEEENNLNAQLKTNTPDSTIGQDEIEIENNLRRWKEVLFGGSNPQVDFDGNVDKFVAVRREWDQYIDTEGSSLPIGWVTQ